MKNYTLIVIMTSWYSYSKEVLLVQTVFPWVTVFFLTDAIVCSEFFAALVLGNEDALVIESNLSTMRIDILQISVER
jgi:hypothetical protein